MSSQGSQRLSLKASNDVATRQAMTQRRQEWATRIRKAKKDHVLAVKRRYVPPVNLSPMKDSNDAAGMDLADTSLVDLANQAIQNPTLHLEAFQSALSRSDAAHQGKTSAKVTQTHPPMILKPDDLVDPLSLINVLAGVIIAATTSAALKLAAARVLTNLAAMDAPQDDDDYYGNPQESWSTLLVKGHTLKAFDQVLTSQTADNNLVLQCCWALGNLIGDSKEAHDASIFLFPTLLHTLIRGLEQKQPSVCRNAAWAISSFVRGTARGGAEIVFCGPDLLTPSLLAQLLVSPERETNSVDGVSWMDVAQEAAWIVAFLTAIDDAVVDYLCSGSHNVSFSSQSPVVILEALACRLHNALQRTRQASTWSSEEATNALKMTIPCLRAIGNIASSSHGKHLPALLTAHSKSIVKSLATLLDLGIFPSSTSHNHLATAAVEAAWAARTLLCDAGLADHQSTDIAIPVLLPQLCKCVTSGYGKQDLKREAISALWTATAAPPGSSSSDHSSNEQQGSIWSTRATRDDFLRQIGRTPHMMTTLVDLLKTSVDADVVHTTLQLVNAMLRRLQDDDVELKRDFEENDGVNALEHICNVASSTSHYGGGTDWNSGDFPAADIAADLIDDLFDVTHEDEIMDVAPVSDGTSFTFGLPATNPVNSETVMPSRGRGRPVPSWMSSGSQ